MAENCSRCVYCGDTECNFVDIRTRSVKGTFIRPLDCFHNNLPGCKVVSGVPTVQNDLNVMFCMYKTSGTQYFP